MRRAEIVGFGVLLFSLALVTVAVESRVVRVRQALAQEFSRQQDLEVEVYTWWWRKKWWQTPDGCEKLKRLLGKDPDVKSSGFH